MCCGDEVQFRGSGPSGTLTSRQGTCAPTPGDDNSQTVTCNRVKSCVVRPHPNCSSEAKSFSKRLARRGAKHITTNAIVGVQRKRAALMRASWLIVRTLLTIAEALTVPALALGFLETHGSTSLEEKQRGRPQASPSQLPGLGPEVVLALQLRPVAHGSGTAPSRLPRRAGPSRALFIPCARPSANPARTNLRSAH